LESDLRVTADGVAVLHHDPTVRIGWRRQAVAVTNRAHLPAHIPTLGDLYAACGAGFELSLDVGDVAAVAPAVAQADRFDPGIRTHLWLCHPDRAQLAEWRHSFPGVRLVNSTRLRRLQEGPERRAAQLAEAGIDAVNLHRSEWSAGLTTLFHRFDRLAFGWDAQHERMIAELLDMGIDGVYSDHVDRMMSVLGGAGTPPPLRGS